MKRWLAAAGLAIGVAAPWAAWAVDHITAADAEAIRGVVQSQIDALSNDDADSAFQLATPERRMIIGNPDNFLRLIKEEYNPIYRHRAAIFQAPEVVDGDAIQMVRITDSDGAVWVAVFQMQQEKDKSWKVDGCELLRTTSFAI
jgi:hypothetical protein